MKRLLILTSLSILFVVVSCGDDSSTENAAEETNETAAVMSEDGEEPACGMTDCDMKDCGKKTCDKSNCETMISSEAVGQCEKKSCDKNGCEPDKGCTAACMKNCENPENCKMMDSGESNQPG